jgi:hypothetical protein
VPGVPGGNGGGGLREGDACRSTALRRAVEGRRPSSAAVPATTLLDVSVVDLFGLGRIAFPD